MTGRRMSGRGAKGTGGSGGAKRRRPATPASSAGSGRSTSGGKPRPAAPAARKGAPAGSGGRSAGTSKGAARAGARGAAGGQGSGRRRQSEPRGLGGEQVEGRQAVRELLLAGRRRVREIYVAERSPATAGDPDATDGSLGDGGTTNDDIVELAADLRVLVRVVGRNKLASVARTEAPQGVVAIADPLEPVDLADLAQPGPDGTPPFLVALDGVTDPGNLGAVLRAAECAGATGVVLPRHRAVHVTPTAAKAAAGAVEHLPMALVSGLPSGLGELSRLGVWSVGLDAGGPVQVWDLGIADQPVVLVLGAEGAGLSRLVRQRCDELASIPLRGSLGSLNVATAAAVACFEVARRRQRSA
jgi:23S rRNA (guanosine2251-2'-O)-methyltransferase